MNTQSVTSGLAAPVTSARHLAWIAVELLAAIFILTFTVPWQPAAEAPIGAFDFSWMLLLNDAVATGRQFGTQIILPQGPTGFIGTNVYDPRTHGVLITVRCLIALAVFWWLRQAARKLIANPFAALVWMLGIILLIGHTADHFFPGCAILLLADYFLVNRRVLARSAIPLIGILAASSLIKVNQPFYAIVAIATITLDMAVQRRRWFFVPALVYVVMFGVSYLSARQSPSSFPAFIWGWSQVAMGHADAVGLPGPLIDPITYLVIVACVVALVARREWKVRRFAGALPVVGLAALLLLLYKHSFMRQDIIHVQMGPMVVVATAMLYWPALWSLGGRVWQGLCVAVMCLACIMLTSILSSYTGNGLLDYVMNAPLRCGTNIAAAASHFTDPQRLYRQWAAARQKLRDDNPLPLDKIEGTVDVYPHRQDVVFAYGLDYSPRPVVSSLVATAPSLADVNARHLLLPSAARTILFDIELVDQNYPTMLDGESLPELLTLYDVIDSSGAMLVLRRATTPRTCQFVPLVRLTGRFQEPLAIPPPVDAPIWAHIRFRKRNAGRLIAAIYKSPSLLITVHPRAGDDAYYRLLPSLAEQGFLLSPLIKDRAAYARLASTTWGRDLRESTVDSITISVEDGSQEASFDPQFDVELKSLMFDHQH